MMNAASGCAEIKIIMMAIKIKHWDASKDAQGNWFIIGIMAPDLNHELSHSYSKLISLSSVVFPESQESVTDNNKQIPANCYI